MISKEGWMIVRFGFDAAFLTMAVSYIVAGLLLLFIREEQKQAA